MGVASYRFLSHAIRFMWQYGHSRLSMLVVDALVPIWHQDICNHCDHGARSVYIRRVEHNTLHLQDTMGRLHYSMAHSVLSWWSVNYIKPSAAPYIYTYIYIYYPLYTNWPITNADLPHVIIQYILYLICQKLYWTVSGQLSNIGYIGQFQNEATVTLRTRYRRTKAVSTYLMKILSIFLHLRKILICFRIGWFL